MKRPVVILLAAALVAVLVVGLVQTQGSTEEQPAGVVPSPAAAQEALDGAPAPLAEVHRLANALLDADEFEPRLEALRGHPVVVNVWGSWCNPCREEFPVFQRVAVQVGKRVAFLGLATQDSREGAGAFLREHPVTYPSYMDFDGSLADELGVIGAPATIFIDSRGERAYFHQGKYDTDEDLLDDIERYLGG